MRWKAEIDEGIRTQYGDVLFDDYFRFQTGGNVQSDIRLAPCEYAEMQLKRPGSGKMPGSE